MNGMMKRIGAVAGVVIFAGCSQSGGESRTRTAAAPPLESERVVVASTTHEVAPPSGQARYGVRSDRESSPRFVQVSDRRAPEAVPVGSDNQSEITIEQIRRHVENGSATFIDARGTREYAQGHLRGAINIPPSRMEEYTDLMLKDVDRNQLLILYCGSSACHASDMVHEYLLSRGFNNMIVYKPGWAMLARYKNLQ